MKENDIKKILSKPIMDQSMEDKILNVVLYYDPNNKRINYIKNNEPSMNQRINLSSKVNFNLSRIAIILIALLIIGTGTVYAASIYVKSYKTNIKFMTENELLELREKSDVTVFELVDKKVFGTGNRQVTLLTDSNGEYLEMDEEGYYIFEDGSKYKPNYEINKNRHELDKKSGDEAFAEIGYQNIIPTYLYENYLLSEGGYHYSELRSKDNITRKDIVADFFPDYFKKLDFNKRVWITFSIDNMNRTEYGAIHINDNASNYINSSFTTKNGIVCTIMESTIGKQILVHINFSSEEISSGSMMLEFHFIDMDEVKEILDTIPLIEGKKE